MKLLVVEDCAIDYLIASHAIRGLGEVVWCRCPEDAVQKADGTFDCLLIDYLLPGCLGDELLRHLRDKGIRSPAVIMSGASMDDRWKAWGAQAFFSKDDLAVKPERLAEVIRQITSGRAGFAGQGSGA